MLKPIENAHRIVKERLLALEQWGFLHNFAVLPPPDGSSTVEIATMGRFATVDFDLQRLISWTTDIWMQADPVASDSIFITAASDEQTPPGGVDRAARVLEEAAAIGIGGAVHPLEIPSLGVRYLDILVNGTEATQAQRDELRVAVRKLEFANVTWAILLPGKERSRKSDDVEYACKVARDHLNRLGNIDFRHNFSVESSWPGFGPGVHVICDESKPCTAPIPAETMCTILENQYHHFRTWPIGYDGPWHSHTVS